MKIIVYGLGIIGASVAASLKAAGHEVLGKNRSQESVEYALAHHMIDAPASDYEGADVIFLALPPYVTMQLLSEGNFPAGCIVSDICGVKEPLEKAVYAKPRDWYYVGTHPMAGKETSGIRSAREKLFHGANFIITRCEHSNAAAIQTVRDLANDMQVGRIIECDADMHDRMIALTSQLAHVVANAYVTSPLSASCKGFTGGSFQDMSRVAPVDESVWSELFSINSTYLAEEIERLEKRLEEFRKAVLAQDEDKIQMLMREGKASYGEFFRGK